MFIASSTNTRFVPFNTQEISAAVHTMLRIKNNNMSNKDKINTGNINNLRNYDDDDNNNKWANENKREKNEGAEVATTVETEKKRNEKENIIKVTLQ